MSLPNIITLGRIFLVPFFFTELVTYTHDAPQHRWIALWIFVIASASDALDGLIARLSGKRTELGRFLDPLADKLLLLSGYIGLLFVEALPYRPPIWITVTVVFRDLVVIGGMLLIFLMNGTISIKPNFLGKVTTVFQMATLITVLLGVSVSIPLWHLTALLTILSCFAYMIRDFGKLKERS